MDASGGNETVDELVGRGGRLLGKVIPRLI